jgi:hypothetical protein
LACGRDQVLEINGKQVFHIGFVLPPLQNAARITAKTASRSFAMLA